jgi:hypothetical protein
MEIRSEPNTLLTIPEEATISSLTFSFTYYILWHGKIQKDIELDKVVVNIVTL